MNVLYWIKKEDNWATFIANRVNEIWKLTDPEAWQRIQGKFNPADLPSRGCNPKALLKSHWWEGPDWLKLLHEEWPASEIKPGMEIVISERRRTVLTATTLDLCRFAFFQKISSFNKIREAFSGREKFNFRTMKYSDDLLRVETRIASRKDLEIFRFPILLPHKHQMVEKLIMSKHLQLEHAGTQTLMSCLRESFWVIKSRKTVQGVIKRCTKCRRFSACPLEAVSIPLPEDRVRDVAVFEVTGIDLCRPLFLKTDNKCWIVLATCAVYRTVHLELVSSLSTECFIQALRRFIARRGRPSTT
ncbi:integrase catalytic domain-containing protein [Trichonephila clavipes]|uniref:Integrase catalytic domain-containing protein n=1 Tax=Trichonephila clavipes TaxID=2585209 RepID=A0A8X6V8Y0_TRICX|nr:integrase catalytic domain-containing protein [Trichonephila clavipes]